METKNISWNKALRVSRLKVIYSLLAGAIFFSHFQPASYLEHRFGPFISPIEFLIQNGRVFSAACFLLAILVLRRVPRGLQTLSFHPASLLLLLNLYLSIKLAFFGFYQLSILSAILVYVQFFLFSKATLENFRRQTEDGLTLGNTSLSTAYASIGLAGVLIVCINIFVLLTDPSNSLDFNGRMHGTTGNPQHLGMIIATTVPLAIFTLLKRRRIMSFLASIAIGIAAMLVLAETGSRTGMGSFLFFVACVIYISSSKRGRAFLPLYSLFLSVFLLAVKYETLREFFLSRGDTRSHQFELAISLFFDHDLIFGAPPIEETGRYLFIENGWLAAASAGGMIAVFILLVLLIRLMVLAWNAMVSKQPRTPESACAIALTVSIVFISLFEAIFLGVFAAHTMIVYFALSALSMSQYSPRGRAT